MAKGSDPTAKKIGAQVWLANNFLSDARLLHSCGSRNAVNQLFYAVEAALIAVMTAEGVHVGAQHRHQLAAILDDMPDENPLKADFRKVEGLTSYATTYRYATPGGNVPRAPKRDDVDGWLDTATSIIGIVTRHFGVDVTPDEFNAVTTITAPPR
ncbi:HEPN domain-containing protein [Asaia sp. As-1742]|uniref:HEPN domain-containing protein n=1 Tax=Asaia sp. As-1742 TaxID=2608325 RepID=UPI0014224FCA|nr:HEPN domain-containing protein [Asaia sp. As-1742]NIE81472.1 HEPN domain-containing protein [Asaia sp. As-1742]